MSHAAVGIDLGTTSTKGVLVAADGRVLATAEREATLSSPHPTWAEMDPEQWWSNTCAVLCELIAAAGSVRIVAVGVSGMVPALVALGGDDRPLRPSIQQNDARTAREIDEAIAEFGQERFFERTGGSVPGAMPASATSSGSQVPVAIEAKPDSSAQLCSTERVPVSR